MVLHLVNKSPHESNALQSCLRHALPESAILLYENGVLGAVAGSLCHEQLSEVLSTTPVYALTPDVETRGISDHIQKGIKLITHAEFVDLVIEHIVVQAWN